MGKATIDLSARTLKIFAVIFAAGAVFFAADTLNYRISHRNCTETVLAHAEHVERESGRNGSASKGYTYTVEYSYEYDGKEYKCEKRYIEDTIKNINTFYNDKEIKIDPSDPAVYIVDKSGDDEGYGLSLLLLTAGTASFVFAVTKERKGSDK